MNSSHLPALPIGFERPPCTICDGQDTKHFPWGDYHLNLLPPLQVSRCSRCGMLFLSPRPNQDLRLQFMREHVPEKLQAYAKSTASYFAVTDQRRETFKYRVLQLEEILKASSNFQSPIILDIGASSGTFVKLACDHQWRAFGVEPSLHGVQAAFKQGMVFPMGVAENLPFADASFDVVHSHHVFEHLADPMQVVREAFRVLRPGGLIFIEVPNQFENIMFHRDMIFRRVPQRQRNVRSIHHLWFFGRKTLKDLLLQGGFQQVQVFDYFRGGLIGWRIPFTLITRFLGKFAYGGDFLNAWGWKLI